MIVMSYGKEACCLWIFRVIDESEGSEGRKSLLFHDDTR
jgi:hypothetical protein